MVKVSSQQAWIVHSVGVNHLVLKINKKKMDVT